MCFIEGINYTAFKKTFKGKKIVLKLLITLLIKLLITFLKQKRRPTCCSQLFDENNEGKK